MMAPKIQEDENIVNNNNKGDSPAFKLNIEDTAVHGGNTDSNSTNNRCVKLYEIMKYIKTKFKLKCFPLIQPVFEHVRRRELRMLRGRRHGEFFACQQRDHKVCLFLNPYKFITNTTITSKF